MCSSITAELRLAVTRHDDGRVDWYVTHAEPDGRWDLFDEGGPVAGAGAAEGLTLAVAAWLSKELPDVGRSSAYAW